MTRRLHYMVDEFARNTACNRFVGSGSRVLWTPHIGAVTCRTCLARIEYMTTPMDFYSGEQIDSATLVGDNEPWWVVEAGNGPDDITLVWTESMKFHAERDPGLVDEDGDPLPRVPELLQTELRRLLGREDVTVEVSSQDEPALEVTAPLTVEPCTVERLAHVVWPYIATLTNVFDPGTFGAEYVMGNVAHIIEESA